ncbi:MAG: transcriptional repressor LexA [Candidatus Desulfatibia sp.]|uniref:transcriptional repressor LexA n=1 Tax=Candidatus Desulfatibia sp. TaxID=3101189 RepID=UPI002F2D9D11
MDLRMEALAKFYRENRRMPSFSELGEISGLKSKNAVSKLVTKLEKMNLLKKDKKGKLIPLSMPPFSGVRVLGTVEAGFPSPAEEELADILSLDEFLIKNRNATFMLKVSGDSMSEAGIIPGDMVLIDKSLSPKSGDIVIACVDDQWTMKFLRKRGKSVTLVPANPAYKPIRPKRELSIAGVVTAVIRKYS